VLLAVGKPSPVLGGAGWTTQASRYVPSNGPLVLLRLAFDPAGRAPSARRAASTRRRGVATVACCSRADAAVVVVEDRYRRLGRE
jgi:hypothetical protein